MALISEDGANRVRIVDIDTRYNDGTIYQVPLAHEKLGTKDGTVRFAPSVFSRASDTLRLAANLKNYVNILKSPENLLKNSGDMLQ